MMSVVSHVSSYGHAPSRSVMNADIARIALCDYWPQLLLAAASNRWLAGDQSDSRKSVIGSPLVFSRSGFQKSFGMSDFCKTYALWTPCFNARIRF